jgi:CubicO group peptidase (beta-lactamase class C family)
MTALVALVLADRGVIDLDAPVARYWPEFARAGKSGVLVRHVLGHTSGLAGWTETMTLEDLYDLEKSCDLLARQEPWWKPGTAAGYHCYTIGHLVHGIVSRTTGLSLGEFFRREIAGPLGGDFQIGTRPQDDSRVAHLIPATELDSAKGENWMFDRACFNPRATPYDAATVEWRRAEIGGANGHGNARGVATIQSVLANGGVSEGVRILSAKSCERVLERQSSGMDLVLGAEGSWGMGYRVASPLIEARLGGRAQGHRWAAWGGNGGSWIMVDFDLRMAVAFVMNRWIGGFDVGRCFDVVNAAYDSVAVAR